ncbi:MAG: ABC transporter permease [Longimicrobiales bacterium]
MDTLVADLRYALRKLARAPGFTFVALLTLALGIGANSAIFSVVYGVLFRPLPFPEPQQLVRVNSIVNGNTINAFSSRNYLDLAEQNDVFADVAALSFGTLTVTGAGTPLDVQAGMVSANFFDVMGVRPQLGSGFAATSNEPGNTRVVVLSNGLWQQQFGADRAIVGQTITLGREAYVVLGVMPAGFGYPGDMDAWVPLTYTAQFRSEDSRGGFFLNIVGRLRDDVTLERAHAAVAALGQRIDRDWEPTGFDFSLGMEAESLRAATIGDVRTPLLVLLGAVGFVLLIACANVANLLLARASIRESEMAVRTALGAGRGRIIRQLVTESVVLGLIGGMLGLVLALWGSAALVRMQPGNLPRITEVRVDGAVVAFTFGIAIVAGLLFGLLPALQTSRITPYGALREAGRGQHGTRRSQRLRGALVIAEIALAVLLLAGAGLLIRSFATLIDVDPGFRSDSVAAFRIGLPAEPYPDDERRSNFFGDYLERIRTLPGVESVGAISELPLSPGTMRIGFDIIGQDERFAEQAMDVRIITPDYLATLDIPVHRGRGFEPADRAGAQPVALINEAAAQRFFSGSDPLGRVVHIGWGRDAHPDGVTATVVGVVGDVKLQELGEDPLPTVYLAHAQASEPVMNIVVRTQNQPLALTSRLRDELQAIDANLPLDEIRTLDSIVAASVAQPRFYMVLLLLFAAVALVLAAVGIFGVMSFVVAQRRQEIGIRMALGAPNANVLRLVVGHALALTAAGIVIGLAAAFALTHLLDSLLFGVAATDAVALFGATALLGGTAFIASYLPARRAARMDPLTALRLD